MGAHAGSFFFDRRPIAEACDAVIAGLEPIAPDGVSVDTEDGLVMAHGACMSGRASRAGRSRTDRPPGSWRRGMDGSTTATISCCASVSVWVTPRAM